jgi:capsular polysaccharide biosynthesis protein
MQLDNRANTLRLQYQDISQKLLSAQNSARMAQEQKGERLSVIDPPVVPDKPTSPNRLLLIIGGIVGGLGLGLALALMLELILRPIRGVDQIGSMGLEPLAVVPTFSPDRPKGRGFFGFGFGRKRPRAGLVQS